MINRSRNGMPMTLPSVQPQNDPSAKGVRPGRRSLRKRGWRLAALQLAVLLLLTGLMEIFDVDRRLAAHFFRAGAGWYLAKAPLWAWLYKYGTIPGLILTLGALAVWLAGLYVPALRSWRKPCLLVVLTTVIGAGVLVNSTFKQYWGRPRPSQTIEFGGKWAYRPISSPGTPGKGASFPCGHCTMGFVFLAMIGFRRKSRALAVSGITVGMILGVLLSAARIVQGAHFLSDTIWSLGIISMTVTIFHAYLAPFSDEVQSVPAGTVSHSRRMWITTATVIGALIMAGGFLTRRPYYDTMVYPLAPVPGLQVIRIRINTEPERVTVRYGDQPAGRLQVDAHGFGWLKFDYHMGFDARVVGRTMDVSLKAQARSYFAELDHALTLFLPRSIGHPVKVMINGRQVGSSSRGADCSGAPRDREHPMNPG
jgi:lipid A 4'-phosphatase